MRSRNPRITTNKENDNDVDQSNDERDKKSGKRRLRQMGEEVRNGLVKVSWVYRQLGVPALWLTGRLCVDSLDD